MSYDIPADWQSAPDAGSPAAAAASSSSSPPPAFRQPAAGSSNLLLEFDPLEESIRPAQPPSPTTEVSPVEATGEHVLPALPDEAEPSSSSSSPPPPELPPKQPQATPAHVLQQPSRSSSVSSLASLSSPAKPTAAPQHSSLITAIAGTFKRKPPDSAAATASSSGPEAEAAAGKGKGAASLDREDAKPVRSQSTSSSKSGGGQAQFDFPRFLDQLKSRSAEPVAKYLKSFLTNFAKRSFTMNESIKLVRDFLDFIAQRMAEVDPWRAMDEGDFEMALEGMEKLVMNRVYPFTFTPQIDRSKHSITTDDLEQDNVLAQRARLFGWIEGQHLDIDDGAEAEARGDVDEAQAIKGYLKFAGQELLKVNHYKAPRDKLICILNCCKVIFGLMRHLSEGSSNQGADSFIPILIYVVLKSNPPHLVSNIEYINRFRSASKLQAEAGYYLSSLTGTITFIESMDCTSLSNITKEEFEANVESAVAHLPPVSPIDPPSPLRAKAAPTSAAAAVSAAAAPFSTTLDGEEPAAQITSGAQTFALDTKRFLAENISRPLNAIGKIFADVVDGSEADRAALGEEQRRRAAATAAVEGGGGGLDGRPPYQPRLRSPRPRSQVGSGGGLPATPPPAAPAAPAGPSLWDTISADLLSVLPSAQSTPPPPAPAPTQDYYAQQQAAYPGQQPQQQSLSNPYVPFSNEFPDDDNIDFERLQAELDRRAERARHESLTTLAQMFPSMDAELVAMVLDAKQGDLGQAAEAMLDMGVN